MTVLHLVSKGKPRAPVLPVMREHGEQVIVLDGRGRFVAEGVIVGRIRMNPMHYDIRTCDGEWIPGVPEFRLRVIND